MSNTTEPVVLSSGMAEALRLAHAFAESATPAVLYGETGTGKTFLAEYIHRISGRAGGFHNFGLGTVAPTLVLDALFGHVKGAFTDARDNRPGCIATAGPGTLLLDDVHTVELGVQKQLLQVLDRGFYSPVGTDRKFSMACRIIFAMADDPDVLMKQGILLKDLRWRFGLNAIYLPPLRERKEEIPLLAERALAQCPHRTGIDGPSRFTDAAIALLRERRYEGNARELTGVVERAFLLARYAGETEIGVEHLPVCCPDDLQYRRRGDRARNQFVVEQILQKTGGNAAAAAKRLGISRNTVNANRAVQ